MAAIEKRDGTGRIRDPKYDCLRLISVLSILMVHSMPVETADRTQWWFNCVMTPVLLAFVGIYFMTSGMFLLERGTEDIGRFYKKRAVQIGVPFLIYDLIYYCYNVRADQVSISLPAHGAEFLRQAATAQVPRAGHLWFMYAMAAFYLCAPFLARMVKAMTDQELKVFLLLMLGLHGLDVAGEILGMSFGPWMQYVLYTGWVYYFVLGYGLRRLGKKRHVPVALVLAAAGLVWDVAAKLLLPWWTPANPHKSPAMACICAAVFLTVEFYGDRIPGWFGRIAGWISRYSYSVYLIHFLVIRFYVAPAMDGLLKAHYILGTLAVTAVGFAVSLAVSMAVDTVITGPVLRLLAFNRKMG